MEDINYCQHCYPLKNNHLPKKIGSILNFYVGTPTSYFFTSLFPKNIPQVTGKLIKRAFIGFSTTISHIKLTESIYLRVFFQSIKIKLGKSAGVSAGV